MKNTKRLLSMVFALVFMFTVMMSGAVFADKGNDKGNDKSSPTTEEKVKGNDKAKVEEAVTEDVDSETEEEQLSEEKASLLAEKKELKKALADARKKASGATETEIADIVAAIAANKEQLKQLVMEQYTEEELVQLEQAAAGIEAADPTVEVLPLEKVIAKGRSMKFDVPPVIKDGKVLVPVRAFSAAYGADVQWNAETHEITIVKDGITIVVNIDTNVVKTGDVETTLEMPVKSINGRTVMPVGFLAEQLGLKVQVDEEDGTVEVDEDADPLLNITTP